jgi:hypothetical protein
MSCHRRKYDFPIETECDFATSENSGTVSEPSDRKYDFQLMNRIIGENMFSVENDSDTVRLSSIT